jgi:hypothetical protein
MENWEAQTIGITLKDQGGTLMRKITMEFSGNQINSP